MTHAIATGLVKANSEYREYLYACANHYDKLCENTKRLGIHPLKNTAKVAKTCDWVIVAVNPYLVKKFYLL